MIDVALIGCGYWGSKLRRYLDESEEFDLMEVCDSKSDLRSSVWKNPAIQAVVIATPNRTHFPLARAALESGKHVLVEKPLALTVGECETLAELTAKTGRTLETEFTYTYSKGLKQAREWLWDDLSTGIEMRVSHLGRFGGGDVYWLLGSHMLSVLDMFTPIGGLNWKQHDIYKHNDIVETGDLLFSGEVSGRISLSLNSPQKEVRIVFYGPGLAMTYDPLVENSVVRECYDRKDWIVGDQLSGQRWRFASNEGHNLRYAIIHFARVIEGLEGSNVERAIAVTKVLEEIHQQDKEER